MLDLTRLTGISFFQSQSMQYSCYLAIEVRVFAHYCLAWLSNKKTKKTEINVFHFDHFFCSQGSNDNGVWNQVDNILFQSAAGRANRTIVNCGGSTGMYDLVVNSGSNYYRYWRFRQDGSKPVVNTCPTVSYFEFKTEAYPLYHVCKSGRYLRRNSDWEMCGTKVIRSGSNATVCQGLCDQEQLFNCSGVGYENGRCHLFASGADCGSNADWMDWYSRVSHMVCEKQPNMRFCGNYVERTGSSADACVQLCNTDTFIKCRGFAWLPEVSKCLLHEYSYNCSEAFTVNVTRVARGTRSLIGSQTFTWGTNQTLKYTVPTTSSEGPDLEVAFSSIPYSVDLAGISLGSTGFISFSPSVTPTPSVTITPSPSVTPTVSPSAYPTRVLRVLNNATSLIAVQWTGFSLNPGTGYYTAVDAVDGSVWGYSNRQWISSERQLLQPNALMDIEGATTEIHGFQFVAIGRTGQSMVGFQSIASDADSIMYGFSLDDQNLFTLYAQGSLVATTWSGYKTGDRFELRFMTNSYTLLYVHNGYIVHSVNVSASAFPLVVKVGAANDARVREVLWLNNIDAMPTKSISIGSEVEWTGYNYYQLVFDSLQKSLLRIDSGIGNADAWGLQPISRTSPVKGISFRCRRNGGWIGFTILDTNMGGLLDYGLFLSTDGAIRISESGTMDTLYIGTFNQGDLIEMYFTTNKVFEVAREGIVLYTGTRPYDITFSEWPMMLRMRSTRIPTEIYDAKYIGSTFTAPTISPPSSGDRVYLTGYDPLLYVPGAGDVNVLNKLNSNSWSYVSSREFMYSNSAIRGVSFQIGAAGQYIASLTKTSACTGSSTSTMTYGLNFNANWRISLYLSGILQPLYLFGYTLDDKITMFITSDYRFSVMINDVALYTTPYAIFGTADYPLIFNIGLYNSYSNVYNIVWVDETGLATPWPSPSITPTISSSAAPTSSVSVSAMASPSPSMTQSLSASPTPTLTPGMVLDSCLALKIANYSSGVYTLSTGARVFCEMNLYGGGWELGVVISQNMLDTNATLRGWYDSVWSASTVKYKGWLGVPWNTSSPLTPFTVGGNNLHAKFVAGQTQVMYEFVNGYGLSYAGWCDTNATWSFSSQSSARYTCQKADPYGSGHQLCIYGDYGTCSGLGWNEVYRMDIALSSPSYLYAYQAIPNYYFQTKTNENFIRAFDTTFDNDNSVGVDALVRVYVRKPSATPLPSASATVTLSPSTTASPSVSLVLSASPLPSVPTPTNPIDIRSLCSNGTCGPVLWTGFNADSILMRPYMLEKIWTFSSASDSCDTNVMGTYSILSSTDKLRGYYFTVQTNAQNMFAGIAATNKNSGQSGFLNANLGIGLDSNSRITAYDAGIQGGFLGGYYPGDTFVLFIDPITLRGVILQNNRLIYTSRTLVDFTSPLTPVINLCSRGLAVFNATWIDNTFTWTVPSLPSAGDAIQWTGFHDSHIEVDKVSGRLKKLSNNNGWSAGTQPNSIFPLIYSDVSSGRITGIEFSVFYSKPIGCARIGFEYVAMDDGINADVMYAFDFCTDSSIQIIDNGASIGCYGGYLPSDVFQLRIVNNQFQYVRNNQIVYTSVVVFTQSTFGQMTLKAMMYTSKSFFEYFKWIGPPYTTDTLPSAGNYISWTGIYPYPFAIQVDARNGTLSKEYQSDGYDAFAVAKHAIQTFQDGVMGFTFQPVYSSYTLRVGFASMTPLFCANNVNTYLKYAIELTPGTGAKGEVRVYPSSTFSMGYMPSDWFQLRLRTDVDKTYVEFALNGFVFYSTEASVSDLPLQPVVAFQTRFGLLTQLAWISPDQFVTVDTTAANKTVTWKYDANTALLAGDGSLQTLSTTAVYATSDRTFSQVSFVRGVSFRVPKNNVAISIGFALHPYSSYTIRFGMSLDVNSRITAIDNKFNSDLIGAFNSNDQFELRLNEDNRFEMVRNGFVLYTSIIALNDASEFPMVLMLTMTGTGAKITEAKWIGSSQFASDASIREQDALLWAGRFDQYTIVAASLPQSIEKLTGASWDALAVSQGRMETRDASVRGITFRPAYNNMYVRVGLARAADDTGVTGVNSNTASNIKWSMDMTPSGGVVVFDRATYKGVVGSFTANDEFQIRLNSDNKFEFMRSGTILYTSFDAVYVNDFPLVLNVAMYSAGSKLTGVHWISAQQFLAELTFKSLDPLTWTGVNTAILIVDPSTGAIQKLGSSSSFDNTAMSAGRIRSLSSLSVKGIRFITRQNNKNFKIGFGLAGVMYFGVQLDASGRVRVKDFLDSDATTYGTLIGTYLPNDVFVIGINDNNLVQVMRSNVLLYTSSKEVRTVDLPFEITTSFYSPGAQMDNPVWIASADYPTLRTMQAGDMITWSGYLSTTNTLIDPTAGILQKLSVTSVWDMCVTSQYRLVSTADAVAGISFKLPQNSKSMRIGFTRVDRDAGDDTAALTLLEFGVVISNIGWLQAVNNRVYDSAAGFLTSFSKGDEIQFRFNNANQLDIIRSGVAVYTTSTLTSSSFPLVLQACIQDSGGRFEAIKWINKSMYSREPVIGDGDYILWNSMNLDTVAVDSERSTVSKTSTTSAWDAYAVSNLMIARQFATLRGFSFFPEFRKAFKIGFRSARATGDPTYGLYFFASDAVTNPQLRAFAAGSDAGISTIYGNEERFVIQLSLEAKLEVLRFDTNALVYRSPNPIPAADFPVILVSSMYDNGARFDQSKWIVLNDCGISNVQSASLLNCLTSLSGAVCSIRCDAGFQGGFQDYRCNSSGVWQPVSQALTCRPLCDVPCVNGNCTGANQCTCTLGWTGDLCETLIDCGIPSAGNVTFSDCTNTTYGSVCDAECTEGHGPGLSQFSCNGSGVWVSRYEGFECGPVCTLPCQNGAPCVAPETCLCGTGWTGVDCGTPIDCGMNTGDANGYFTSNCNSTYGNTCTARCATGYSGTSLPFVCGANGNWFQPDNLSFKCFIINCGSPPSASLPTGGVFDTGLTTYSTVRYAGCRVGYVSASVGYRCEADSKWYTNGTLVCNSLNCPQPADLVLQNCTDRSYLSTCWGICPDNYFGLSRTYRCQASGLWVSTGAEVTCVPFCHQVCQNNGYCSAPDVCTCADGWEGYDCHIRTDCHTLNAPPYAVTGTCNTTDYSSQCNTTCITGYNGGYITHTCSKYGNWTPNPLQHICTIKNCSVLQIANALTTYLNITNGLANTTYQTVATVKCNTGYLPLETSIYNCDQNGVWTSSKPLTCTPVCDPTCVNGVCTAANTCTCSSGWKSTRCDSKIPTCVTGYCKNGGVCSGTNVCSCSNAAGWKGDDCNTRKNCGQLVVQNTTASCSSTLYGQTCRAYCLSGYVGGTRDYTCNNNEIWQPATPISCVMSSCSALSLPNSVIKCNSSALGGVCNASCASGYAGTNATYNCSGTAAAGGSGAVAWLTSAALSCSPVSCGPLTVLNATVNCASTSYQGTCTASCNTGFVEGSMTYVCRADRTWAPVGGSTIAPLSCSIKYCSFPEVPFASFDGCTDLRYNSVCRANCLRGYTGGSSSYRCQADGSWTTQTPLTCTAKVCGSLSVPAGTALNTCSDNHAIGSVCESSCSSAGYVGTSAQQLCTRDGVWSVKRSSVCAVAKMPEAYAAVNITFPAMPMYDWNESVLPAVTESLASVAGVPLSDVVVTMVSSSTKFIVAQALVSLSVEPCTVCTDHCTADFVALLQDPSKQGAVILAVQSKLNTKLQSQVRVKYMFSNIDAASFALDMADPLVEILSEFGVNARINSITDGVNGTTEIVFTAIGLDPNDSNAMSAVIHNQTIVNTIGMFITTTVNANRDVRNHVKLDVQGINPQFFTLRGSAGLFDAFISSCEDGDIEDVQLASTTTVTSNAATLDMLLLSPGSFEADNVNGYLDNVLSDVADSLTELINTNTLVTKATFTFPGVTRSMFDTFIQAQFVQEFAQFIGVSVEAVVITDVETHFDEVGVTMRLQVLSDGTASSPELLVGESLQGLEMAVNRASLAAGMDAYVVDAVLALVGADSYVVNGKFTQEAEAALLAGLGTRVGVDASAVTIVSVHQTISHTSVRVRIFVATSEAADAIVNRLQDAALLRSAGQDVMASIDLTASKQVSVQITLNSVHDEVLNDKLQTIVPHAIAQLAHVSVDSITLTGLTQSAQGVGITMSANIETPDNPMHSQVMSIVTDPSFASNVTHAMATQIFQVATKLTLSMTESTIGPSILSDVQLAIANVAGVSINEVNLQDATTSTTSAIVAHIYVTSIEKATKVATLLNQASTATSINNMISNMNLNNSLAAVVHFAHVSQSFFEQILSRGFIRVVAERLGVSTSDIQIVSTVASSVNLDHGLDVIIHVHTFNSQERNRVDSLLRDVLTLGGITVDSIAVPDSPLNGVAISLTLEQATVESFTNDADRFKQAIAEHMNLAAPWLVDLRSVVDSNHETIVSAAFMASSGSQALLAADRLADESVLNELRQRIQDAMQTHVINAVMKVSGFSEQYMRSYVQKNFNVEAPHLLGVSAPLIEIGEPQTTAGGLQMSLRVSNNMDATTSQQQRLMTSAAAEVQKYLRSLMPMTTLTGQLRVDSEVPSYLLTTLWRANGIDELSVLTNTSQSAISIINTTAVGSSYAINFLMQFDSNERAVAEMAVLQSAQSVTALQQRANSSLASLSAFKADVQVIGMTQAFFTANVNASLAALLNNTAGVQPAQVRLFGFQQSMDTRYNVPKLVFSAEIISFGINAAKSVLALDQSHVQSTFVTATSQTIAPAQQVHLSTTITLVTSSSLQNVEDEFTAALKLAVQNATIENLNIRPSNTDFAADVQFSFIAPTAVVNSVNANITAGTFATNIASALHNLDIPQSVATIEFQVSGILAESLTDEFFEDLFGAILSVEWNSTLSLSLESTVDAIDTDYPTAIVRVKSLTSMPEEVNNGLTKLVIDQSSGFASSALQGIHHGWYETVSVHIVMASETNLTYTYVDSIISDAVDIALDNSEIAWTVNVTGLRNNGESHEFDLIVVAPYGSSSLLEFGFASILASTFETTVDSILDVYLNSVIPVPLEVSLTFFSATPISFHLSAPVVSASPFVVVNTSSTVSVRSVQVQVATPSSFSIGTPMQVFGQTRVQFNTTSTLFVNEYGSLLVSEISKALNMSTERVALDSIQPDSNAIGWHTVRFAVLVDNTTSVGGVQSKIPAGQTNALARALNESTTSTTNQVLIKADMYNVPPSFFSVPSLQQNIIDWLVSGLQVPSLNVDISTVFLTPEHSILEIRVLADRSYATHAVVAKFLGSAFQASFSSFVVSSTRQIEREYAIAHHIANSAAGAAFSIGAIRIDSVAAVTPTLLEVHTEPFSRVEQQVNVTLAVPLCVSTNHFTTFIQAPFTQRVCELATIEPSRVAIKRISVIPNTLNDGTKSCALLFNILITTSDPVKMQSVMSLFSQASTVQILQSVVAQNTMANSIVLATIPVTGAPIELFAANLTNQFTQLVATTLNVNPLLLRVTNIVSTSVSVLSPSVAVSVRVSCDSNIHAQQIVSALNSLVTWQQVNNGLANFMLSVAVPSHAVTVKFELGGAPLAYYTSTVRSNFTAALALVTNTRVDLIQQYSVEDVVYDDNSTATRVVLRLFTNNTNNIANTSINASLNDTLIATADQLNLTAIIAQAMTSPNTPNGIVTGSVRLTGVNAYNETALLRNTIAAALAQGLGEAVTDIQIIRTANMTLPCLYFNREMDGGLITDSRKSFAWIVHCDGTRSYIAVPTSGCINKATTVSFETLVTTPKRYNSTGPYELDTAQSAEACLNSAYVAGSNPVSNTGVGLEVFFRVLSVKNIANTTANLLRLNWTYSTLDGFLRQQPNNPSSIYIHSVGTTNVYSLGTPSLTKMAFASSPLVVNAANITNSTYESAIIQGNSSVQSVFNDELGKRSTYFVDVSGGLPLDTVNSQFASLIAQAIADASDVTLNQVIVTGEYANSSLHADVAITVNISSTASNANLLASQVTQTAITRARDALPSSALRRIDVEVTVTGLPIAAVTAAPLSDLLASSLNIAASSLSSSVEVRLAGNGLNSLQTIVFVSVLSPQSFTAESLSNAGVSFASQLAPLVTQPTKYISVHLQWTSVTAAELQRLPVLDAIVNTIALHIGVPVSLVNVVMAATSDSSVDVRVYDDSNDNLGLFQAMLVQRSLRDKLIGQALSVMQPAGYTAGSVALIVTSPGGVSSSSVSASMTMVRDVALSVIATLRTGVNVTTTDTPRTCEAQLTFSALPVAAFTALQLPSLNSQLAWAGNDASFEGLISTPRLVQRAGATATTPTSALRISVQAVARNASDYNATCTTLVSTDFATRVNSALANQWTSVVTSVSASVDVHSTALAGPFASILQNALFSAIQIMAASPSADRMDMRFHAINSTDSSSEIMFTAVNAQLASQFQTVLTATGARMYLQGLVEDVIDAQVTQHVSATVTVNGVYHSLVSSGVLGMALMDVMHIPSSSLMQLSGCTKLSDWSVSANVSLLSTDSAASLTSSVTQLAIKNALLRHVSDAGFSQVSFTVTLGGATVPFFNSFASTAVTNVVQSALGPLNLQVKSVLADVHESNITIVSYSAIVDYGQESVQSTLTADELATDIGSVIEDLEFAVVHVAIAFESNIAFDENQLDSMVDSIQTAVAHNLSIAVNNGFTDAWSVTEDSYTALVWWTALVPHSSSLTSVLGLEFYQAQLDIIANAFVTDGTFENDFMLTATSMNSTSGLFIADVTVGNVAFTDFSDATIQASSSATSKPVDVQVTGIRNVRSEAVRVKSISSTFSNAGQQPLDLKFSVESVEGSVTGPFVVSVSSNATVFEGYIDYGFPIPVSPIPPVSVAWAVASTVDVTAESIQPYRFTASSIQVLDAATAIEVQTTDTSIEVDSILTTDASFKLFLDATIVVESAVASNVSFASNVTHSLMDVPITLSAPRITSIAAVKAPTNLFAVSGTFEFSTTLDQWTAPRMASVRNALAQSSTVNSTYVLVTAISGPNHDNVLVDYDVIVPSNCYGDAAILRDSLTQKIGSNQLNNMVAGVSSTSVALPTIDDVPMSPSLTPSPTTSSSVSQTRTSSPSKTMSSTVSPTKSYSHTRTPSSTASSSLSSSRTSSVSVSSTPSTTPTVTGTPSTTPSITTTPSRRPDTPSPSKTATPSISYDPLASKSPTPSITPTPTTSPLPNVHAIMRLSGLSTKFMSASEIAKTFAQAIVERVNAQNENLGLTRASVLVISVADQNNSTNGTAGQKYADNDAYAMIGAKIMTKEAATCNITYNTSIIISFVIKATAGISDQLKDILDGVQSQASFTQTFNEKINCSLIQASCCPQASNASWDLNPKTIGQFFFVLFIHLFVCLFV
jgi:hypothetical protein